MRQNNALKCDWCRVSNCSSTEVSTGVIVDCQFCFKAHVNAVTEACNYHNYLVSTTHSKSADSERCTHSCENERYCDVVVTSVTHVTSHGSPKSSIVVLHRTQNSLARVTLQPKNYIAAISDVRVTGKLKMAAMYRKYICNNEDLSSFT